MKFGWIATAVLGSLCWLDSMVLAEQGYYRWPNASGEKLVFASEGDLWLVSQKDAPPVRLTTHPEEESNPAISPDGQWLAFDAHYEGGQEVYVMPIGGGVPKRITFEGFSASQRGWTPDGRVVFRSMHEAGPRATSVLRTVDPQSLEVNTLPLLDVGSVAFSGDGRTLFLTRFGLDVRGDHSRMYRGGGMAQLWRYQADSNEEAVRLAADFGAPIRNPMWWENRIYFVSDQSGTDNLWSMNPEGQDLQQHSQFQDWQIKDPSLNGGRVYYQRGADLYFYDLASQQESKLELDLISDREFGRVRWLDKPLQYLESARLTGDGKSAAVTARGRVVVAYPGERRRAELDIPSAARARGAVGDASGEWIYVILDQDRNGEIWRYPASGLGQPEQLTSDSDAHIWGIYPSPDDRWLLFDDSLGRLWSLDLKTRVKGLLETGEGGQEDPFGSYTWSTGGRYLAYTATDTRAIRRVAVRDMETGKREIVTTAKYEAFAPSFSEDGKWLYFVSNRNFDPEPGSPWGDRNMGPAFDKRGRLFALQLVPETPFPFAKATELSEEKGEKNNKADKKEKTEPGSDASGSEDETEKKDQGEEKSKEVSDPAIEFTDLTQRLWTVPLPPGNYVSLDATTKFLFVGERGQGGLTVKSVAIDADKATVKDFASRIRGFSLSTDRKSIFYYSQSGDSASLQIVPVSAEAPSDVRKSQLRIGDWKLAVVPKLEWKQLMLDAWRLHRIYSYDIQLRGVDWDAVLDKYFPLVDRVGHRAELDDVFGQMAAELGILHSQVRSGDQPQDDESGANAYLAAEYESVPEGLKIVTIYEGDVDLPETLGPLQQPGVNVAVGDVIAKVNGLPVRNRAELRNILANKSGQQVRLDLLRAGAGRTEIVTPVSSREAATLPYRHWVTLNRNKVSETSKGTIGYLHINAMSSSDVAGFARDFYEHYDKDGLIIDVRGNSGGNIDSWILSTLLRRVWAFWHNQQGEPTNVNMQQTFRGHLVVLIDEGTYSDGETFAAGVKALELGPLVGTTTAGAGIWLSGRNRLVDGGMARIAEFPQFGLDGRWLIEGRGVSPDIPVINPPFASFAGADAQLEKALSVLEEKIKAQPVPKLRGKPLPGLGQPAEDVR